MLKNRNCIPLDYSLCCMTVTVYHREGLTRHVIRTAHYEFTDEAAVSGAVASGDRHFLLVVPGEADIHVGDKVVLGEGPELTDWAGLHMPGVPTLGVVRDLKPRYFKGQLCHTEARG